MPVVQRYGERRVDIRPLSGQRRTAAATALSEGAGVADAQAQQGRAIADLGGAVEGAANAVLRARTAEDSARNREAEQARVRANKLQALAADDAMAQWEIEHVYGDGGALSKKGEAALGVPEETDAAFEKRANEIAATLHDPDVQLSFAQSRQNRRERVALASRRHLETEMRAFSTDKLTAVVKSAVQLAPSYASNPSDGMLAGELKRGTTALRELGTLNGASKETTDMAIATFRTDVHENVLRALVADGKMAQARGYFAAVKGDKDNPSEWGDKVDEMAKLVEEGTSVATAQAAADAIIAEGGTIAEQRAKVKQRTTGEDREKAMALVEHEDSWRKNATKADLEASTLDMVNLADSSKSLAAVMRHPAWSTLSASERTTMKNYLESKAPNAVARKTNQAMWSKLYDAAASDDLVVRQSFLDMDLHKVIGNFSDSDFQELKKLQYGLRKGDKASEDKAISVRSDAQVIAGSLREAGLDPEKDSGRGIERRYFNEVDRRQRAAGNKPLTDEEKTQIADDLTIRVMTADGWFSNSYSTLADLTYEQLSEAVIAKARQDLVRAKVFARPEHATHAAILELVRRDARAKR